MRHPRLGLILLSLLLSASVGGGARAEGGVDCVKNQCEAKGRSCVETLYVAYEACMKAGNKKCASALPADKFNCLRTELKPCASARNEKQDACLAEVRSCYASCGPLESGRADFWCVGELATKTTGAFCAADPADARLMDKCDKAFSSEGQVGSMTCEPL
jgi:hypothetical protein